MERYPLGLVTMSHEEVHKVYGWRQRDGSYGHGGSSQAASSSCYDALCTSSCDTMLYIPAIIYLAYIYEFSPQSSRYLVR